MPENPTDNVMAAFEILIEEIETEIHETQRMGARFFESGDFAHTKRALAHAERMTEFRGKVLSLRAEWETLSRHPAAQETLPEREEQRGSTRLRRGLRTPEHRYFRPILEALQDLGGTAPVGQVLERVFDRMRPILQDVDLMPLASDPEMPRWRNAAQWARMTLVQRGLLRDDSPRGVWAIADPGIRFLQESADG